MKTNVTAITSSSATAAAAKAAAADPRAQKVAHAAGEFESMLVKQLLKSAKLGTSGVGDSEKSGGYADMAVDAMASAVEHGGGLGLQRRIEEAMSPHIHPAASPVSPTKS